MHRLKGKVEAYVVSTMEDNQRTSLLDNLAISIEKVEEEAEKQKKETNERVVSDERLVDDLCDSILCVLEHELKVANHTQKPSFWDVAENITPKDTIKMIYRLNIQQTDKTRCNAWARLALKEATISSYISLLRDDSQLLKEWYRSSAFVRDKLKMDTAFELINEAVSSTIFSFLIENDQSDSSNYGNDGGISPEIPQEIRYTAHKASISSIENTGRRKKKSRTSSMAAISDGSSSHIPSSWCESYLRTHMGSKGDDQVVARSLNGSSLSNAHDNMREKVTSGSDITVPEVASGSDVSVPESPTLKAFGSLTHSESSPFKEVVPHGSRFISTLLTTKNRNIVDDDSLAEVDTFVISAESGGVPESTNESVCGKYSRVELEENVKVVKTSTEDSSNLADVTQKSTDDEDNATCHENQSHFPDNSNCLSNKENKMSNDDSQSDVAPILNEIDSEVEKDNVNKVEDTSVNQETVLETSENIKTNEVIEDTNPFSDHEPTNVINEVDYSLEIDSECKLDTGKPNLSYNQADYSLFEEESSGLIDIEKSNSFSGGSQQLVNVLQLSTSVSSADDYFIPGIHDTPDVESIQQKSEPITSPGHQTKSKAPEAPDTTKSGTLPSTFGSSVSSSAYTFGSEDSESDLLSMGDQSFSLLADLGITDDFIGLKEDHFSDNDSFMGFSSTEELENAIATCKKLIKQTNENSASQKELIQQLIQLRLKLHESKEIPVEVPKNAKKVLGHHFIKQEKLANSIPCDRCSSTIFPMLQVVYQCKDCGFHCHRKCLKSLDKGCIFSKQTVNSACEMRICPEVTLSQQQFRCADCHQRLVEVDGQFDARLCDYTGKRYCEQCHWNEMMIIPARVIHNWDFSPRKVSRQSKQLLQLRHKKADINLQKMNPALFNFLDELRNIKTLREQLMMMKEYIRTCRIATEKRMLLQLQNRQHFVENSFVFSMQDLMDVHSNALYEELWKKIEIFSKHIKNECQLCIGKGFICEQCHSDDIIFPFDDHVIRCQCNATYHRSCFTEDTCPRCIRTARRKEEKEKQFVDNDSE